MAKLTVADEMAFEALPEEIKELFKRMLAAKLREFHLDPEYFLK